jgi:predicted phosphodiesterase
VTRAKILVISDIHYPLTDVAEILSIISKEAPDKLIILGDVGQSPVYAQDFICILEKCPCQDQTFIRGDNDISVPIAIKSLKLDLNGREFLFIHGHQFNVASEGFTKKLARFLKRINKNLPALAYATYSRTRSKSRKSYLILGHSHALVYFPHLRVASSGCFTNAQNVYNDRGYVSIVADNDVVQLIINRLTDGSREVFEI